MNHNAEETNRGDHLPFRFDLVEKASVRAKHVPSLDKAKGFFKAQVKVRQLDNHSIRRQSPQWTKLPEEANGRMGWLVAERTIKLVAPGCKTVDLCTRSYEIEYGGPEFKEELQMANQQWMEHGADTEEEISFQNDPDTKGVVPPRVRGFTAGPSFPIHSNIQPTNSSMNTIFNRVSQPKRKQEDDEEMGDFWQEPSTTGRNKKKASGGASATTPKRGREDEDIVD